MTQSSGGTTPPGTMDCPEARISLGVYVLGAIDPAERALVDAHLAACRECRDELAGLIAPRPLQAQVGRGDTLFAIDEARALAARAMVPYQKAGLPECFDFAEFDGGHEFRGDLAWTFLEKHLGKPSP